MDIFKIVLVSLLSVAELFLITKIMGHKQVSQLDFFDYVCGITIGSIGAELATELDTPERPLVALIVYGAASLILNLLAHKFPKARKYINGTPIILFSGGKLYRENMKKAKLDLSDFMLLCREGGYFDLEEIECAVFEENGKLSILPKAENKPLTPCDIKLPVKKECLGAEVIMDGKIVKETLSDLGKDEKWLKKQTKKQGVREVKDVFLGVYRKTEDKLTLYLPY